MCIDQSMYIPYVLAWKIPIHSESSIYPMLGMVRQRMLLKLGRATHLMQFKQMFLHLGPLELKWLLLLMCFFC
jgi:hypothetical protein